MNRTFRALLVIVLAAVSGCDMQVPLPTDPSLVKHARANAVAENTYVSTDVPKAILDHQTLASTVQASNSGFVTKVTVNFNITHEFDRDLVISLISPAGTIAILVNRRGFGPGFSNTTLDDNATSTIASGTPPFSGTYSPEQPLSTFAGESAQGAWTLRVQDVAGGNQGSLTGWSLTITTTDVAPPPPAEVVNTFQSTDVPKAIPDNGIVSSTLQVPNVGLVTKITVRFSIVHTFDSDLQISLTSPGGMIVLLVNRRGGGGDNFTNTTLDDNSSIAIASGVMPFNATFKPEQPLSGFIGPSAEGTWTLTVQDFAAGDVGQLTAWSLSFTAIPPNVAPTAAAGSDQTVVRTSSAGANVTLDGTGSGDSDGSIATYEWFENGDPIASGSTAQHVFALGAHVLTLRVTDDDGASSEDEVVITVENSPPTVGVSAPLTFACAADGATASFVATGADVDGTITYAWTPTGSTEATTSFFAPLGTTQVLVTVTDNDGATAQAASSVTVSDAQRPVISMVVSPTTLTSKNHGMVKVASGISVSDACDSSPHLTVVVSSNQPLNGKGDGNTSLDWIVVANPNGTYDVYVRAEAAATGTGRIYTITATATDGSGNTSTRSQTVTVPRSQQRSKASR